jgi:hypothetical protein
MPFSLRRMKRNSKSYQKIMTYMRRSARIWLVLFMGVRISKKQLVVYCLEVVVKYYQIRLG